MAHVPPEHFRPLVDGTNSIFLNLDKVHLSRSGRALCSHTEYSSASPESDRYIELVPAGGGGYGAPYTIMEPMWPIDDLTATLCENTSSTNLNVRTATVGGVEYPLYGRDRTPDSIYGFCAGSLDKEYIGRHFWVNPADFYVTPYGELWLDGRCVPTEHYQHGFWPMEIDGKANKIVRVPKDTILQPSATMNSPTPDRGLYLTEKVLLRPVSSYERYRIKAMVNSPMPPTSTMTN